MAQRELLIIAEPSDLNAVEPLLLKKCDKLAITPGAMLALEEKGYNYLTFSDFYHYRQFRSDNHKLIEATDKLFSVLDKKYDSVVNFPRAFTGNIYWFLTFFANIYYISQIGKHIRETYSNIYLSSSNAHGLSLKIDMDFSSKGLNFGNFTVGLSNKILMIKASLGPKCFWLNNVNSEHSSLASKKHRLIHSLKQTQKRILRAPKRLPLMLQTFLARQGKGKVIFVIQDGYEISWVKKHLKEFLYINPMKSLLQASKKDGRRAPLGPKPLFMEEAKEFSRKWFPEFENHVLELFSVYCNKVLSQLPNFLRNLNDIFEQNKPNALFYSISSNRLYEDACADFANQKNIPVFYFQHGATHIFYKQPYQKYLEQNDRIKKINILQSEVEKNFFNSKKSSENVALGSIKLYELYNTCNVKKLRKGGRKILYCSSPFNFFTYRNLVGNKCDKEIFEVNKDILEIVNKLHLEMDVKLHPLDEMHDYLYFKKVLKKLHIKNVRILKGFPVEKIINNYGLLILDCPGGAMFPSAVVFDIPVLMYFGDPSYIRDETIPDVKKRFYLVKNKSDWEQYLRLYMHGSLESKFSQDLVNKYAFSISDGDVKKRIAEYVSGRIAQNK